MLLEMKQISKSFSGVEVLHQVDLAVEKGEVRALLGANGAGKSTLIKILGGVHQATSGTILLDGQPCQIDNPIAAREKGIAVVHQELSIIPTLTVLQNFFLGREIRRRGIIDDQAMRAEYNRVRAEFGFDIEPDVQAKKLSVAQQQMVEIMKSIGQESRVLILDEPTTSLTNDEKQGLFALIGQLKAKGKTIIYISHILEEVFLLADRATIMRNGSVVGTYPVKELTISSISEKMTGHKIVSAAHVAQEIAAEKKSILQVKHLSSSKVHDVSFCVRPGEVVGFAGLVGAGRSEIARAIFGADPHTEGEILVDGVPRTIRSPGDAIRAGIGLVPEDRKNEGLIPKHPIYQNASLVQLRSLRSHGLLSEKREKEFAAQAAKTLSIKFNCLTDPAISLSGGNQQKVVISKWLSEQFRILIFDEPTKGVDIGAKEDIFATVSHFAKMGAGIIFISSDIEEVLRVSDRLLIIRDGTVIAEKSNKNITQAQIMEIILHHAS